MKSNLSNGDGTYVITFTDGQCNVDDVVNVSASLGSLYGFKNGSVLNGTLFDIPLDVAVVNVPLVPEFGFYAAILTVLSAVGIFFVVRKN